MGVDASAVAAVLGITTDFVTLNGGNIALLPQRIAVFAQGNTGQVYSANKRTFTSAGPAGATYGYGSPARSILKEFFPSNGDGVGTIPVTVYPLSDAPGSTAATGDITPSGTALTAGQYAVRAGGVLGQSFVIPKGAISVTDVCRMLGQSISSVPDMPLNVSYVFGAVTAAALAGGTGNGTVTALSVAAGAVPGVYKLALNTAVANGGVWTLTDPNGSIVSTTLTMTPGVGTATPLSAGGLSFTLTDGTTDFGAGAYFLITVPATKVNVTAKWKGTSGNAIILEVLVPVDSTVVFAITQPSGGLVDPDVTAALAQVGDVWETLILNALPLANTTALDAFQQFGEGRWGTITHKPCVVFTGTTLSDQYLATAVSSARKTDRVNAQLVAQDSVTMPHIVAAAQLKRIAVIANNNPPVGYNGEKCSSIIPGADSKQWDYPTKDFCVKAGSSTATVKDGVVTLGDTVTFYAPSDESPPAYRYVVDIVKLMNVIFNVNIIFAAKEWAAAPLIPDNQATVNPKAKKPSMAKAKIAGMIDSLALFAIVSAPEIIKKTISCLIDTANPKRMNVVFFPTVSGNTFVKDVSMEWGFYFPAAA